MKIGVAKYNAGIPNRDIKIIDGGLKLIEKGRMYGLADTYDFKSENALYEKATPQQVNKLKQENSPEPEPEDTEPETKKQEDK